MTDDLVKKLRERGGQWPVAAADRIEALTAEAAKMLAEQDIEYNRKTNAMIERHAKQVKALTADNEQMRNALNQSRLAFAGHVSVQSAIDMIDRAALKGENHD